jgi:hypothetical protein
MKKQEINTQDNMITILAILFCLWCGFTYTFVGYQFTDALSFIFEDLKLPEWVYMLIWALFPIPIALGLGLSILIFVLGILAISFIAVALIFSIVLDLIGTGKVDWNKKIF